MHYTYADASFALLEEMGKEVLGAMNQTQSEPYHGTLLTNLTDVNGTPEELFLGTLSVGDIRTVESILMPVIWDMQSCIAAAAAHRRYTFSV